MTRPAHVLLNPGGVQVMSLSVPAGSYLISAQVQLLNTDSDFQTVTCSLSTGDQVRARLGAFFDADSTALPLEDATSFASPTTVTVTCAGFNVGSGDVGGNQSTLTATQVSSVVSE